MEILSLGNRSIVEYNGKKLELSKMGDGGWNFCTEKGFGVLTQNFYINKPTPSHCENMIKKYGVDV